MTSKSTTKASASASDAVKDVSDTIKSTASDAAEHAKATAADHVAHEADSWDTAASAFGEDSFSRHAAQQLADRLSDAAAAVRSTDLSALQDDVSEFARRHPLVFFGGAAALGFIAARALKASERANLVQKSEERRDRKTASGKKRAKSGRKRQHAEQS